MGEQDAPWVLFAAMAIVGAWMHGSSHAMRRHIASLEAHLDFLRAQFGEPDAPPPPFGSDE